MQLCYHMNNMPLKFKLVLVMLTVAELKKINYFLSLIFLRISDLTSFNNLMHQISSPSVNIYMADLWTLFRGKGTMKLQCCPKKPTGSFVNLYIAELWVAFIQRRTIKSQFSAREPEQKRPIFQPHSPR